MLLWERGVDVNEVWMCIGINGIPQYFGIIRVTLPRSGEKKNVSSFDHHCAR